MLIKLFIRHLKNNIHKKHSHHLYDQSTGIGVVSARASNHYGIAGYYGLMAKDQGLIGMSMTNTSPLQVHALTISYG